MLENLGVHPSFQEFLHLLDAKREGEPLAYWAGNLDFLIVFIGEGDCRNYVLSGFFCPYVDIINKLYPREGEDPFAGFEISGGIQSFLRLRYKKLLGDGYEMFKARHNGERHLYHASELLDMWLEEFPATRPEQAARVKEALNQQNPTVHIPL